jgi:acyl carrier protein/LPS sulfotransferase NodH
MLVAYVVLGAGQVATNDELRHHLRQALPEYMQPAKLQQLPEMPLYPSGKIDRAALPRPSRERQSQQVPYQAAANALQQTLTYIWKDVLDVERIGIHDNFFDAGGHSLSVTMVVARVRDELGVELPLRTMFESPTIELIEKSIKRLQGQAVHEDKPILDELRLAFPTERVPRMAEFLRREIARILNIDPDHITTDQAPATLRLGVGVVDLMRVLKDALKVQFYPPEFLAQSSILSLAEYLLDEIERSANLPEMATEEPLTSFDVKLRFPLYAPHHHVPGIPPPAQKPFSKPVSSGATGKNPPAAFIHATSRSGSTLLRVMLAGHKKLFCPPELNLLFFDNMKQWAEDFGYSDDYQWPALGLHAAFAELKNLGPNEGWQVLDELVAQNRPVGEVYGEVQSLAGGRLLIDKTATYSFDLKVLERGEQLFEEPRYIYLLRHPYSFIESCLRVRLDRLFHRRNQGEPDPDPYAIAEKIWSISHSNLATFFDKVGPARVHVVHYEQLIHDPEPVMRGICEFLGVPFDESVLTPYDGCKARWIATFGDPNILQRSGLDKRLAESWQSLELPRTFSPATRELAKRLGYEVT